MSPTLANRVALVTGASKGIGRAIAIRLAEAGATVALCARPSGALTGLVAEIKADGMFAFAVPANATDETAVGEAVAAAVRAGGRLDVLVNNVGGAIRFAGFEELTAADWRGAFELNVMTMVHFVRAALPHLEKSPAPRIINISSVSGAEPGRYNPHYTTTKAATLNLTKVLANALAGRGILVNAVCPGPVRSAAWTENIRQTAERQKLSAAEAEAIVESEEAAKIPLGRIGEGKDIAGLVAFLASDEASWITGTSFHASGGKMKSI